MKTLILAAGYGTRLYPLTENIAKALLSLGDYTLIDVVLKKLQHCELKDVFVLSNQRFYADFCSWAKESSMDIKVISDGSESPDDMLGAIGDLEFFLNKTQIDDGLLIVGSDNLFSWELDGFVNYVRKHNKPVVGVYDMQDPELVANRFGVVEKNKDDKIIGFEEKPSEPKSALIGTCLYYLPYSSFALLDEYFKAGLSKDAIGQFFAWLSEKTDVYAYSFEGDWLDIGHIDTLETARGLIKNKELVF